MRLVFTFALVALLAFVFAYAGYGLLFPPYTDVEIQTSFIDTWEVDAFFTDAALAFLLVTAVLSAILVLGGSRLAKRLALTAVALSLSSGALFLASHIALTERTTRLTGQTFGGFYGLF